MKKILPFFMLLFLFGTSISLAQQPVDSTQKIVIPKRSPPITYYKTPSGEMGFLSDRLPNSILNQQENIGPYIYPFFKPEHAVPMEMPSLLEKGALQWRNILVEPSGEQEIQLEPIDYAPSKLNKRKIFLAPAVKPEKDDDC